MLVLNLEEVALFVVSHDFRDSSKKEVMQAAVGWIEHMRAGEFPIGRTIPDETPAELGEVDA
jgi:hypothetical protein